MDYCKICDITASRGNVWKHYQTKAHCVKAGVPYNPHYYLKHRDEIRERQKRYAESHKEELKEKHKIYYQDNKEKFHEKSQKYYQDNKEAFQERMKKYDVGKVKCETCDIIMNKGSVRHHKKTIKHKTGLKDTAENFVRV